MTDTPVLSIRDLTVEIPTRRGLLKPVDGVSYDIAAGEILGIVGESGAGKSMAGNATIGLLDRPARIAKGEIWLEGQRIDTLAGEALRQVRGRRIGMIFQDPLTSLNPLLTIGDQLIETMRTHLSLSEADARARAQAALEEVGIPAASERLDSYPHQFSGGMRQRAVIALALAAEPTLVIADEPTTALDVSVQAQVIGLLKSLCRKRGMAVMLITHDIGVIAEAADRIAVMYAGRVVEIGPVARLLRTPRHPYTSGLIGSAPAASIGKGRLQQIPGAMPRLTALPDGCPFHPRCPVVQSTCKTGAVPPMDADGSACHFPLHDSAEASA